MKRVIISLWVISAAGLGCISTAPAQGLPKTQPKLLTITREQVKTGRNEGHSKHEALWPAAYEKAKGSHDYVIAMTSLTGPNEAWYVSGSESHAALGECMKRRDKDPALSAELARLELADAGIADDRGFIRWAAVNPRRPVVGEQ
jgi:hypothetical protein